MTITYGAQIFAIYQMYQSIQSDPELSFMFPTRETQGIFPRKILKPVNHPKLDVDESFPPARESKTKLLRSGSLVQNCQQAAIYSNIRYIIYPF